MIFVLKKRVKQSHQSYKKVFQYSNGEYLPESSQPFGIYTNIYTPHQSTRYRNITIGVNGIAMIREKECVKPLPELYVERDACCGCTACYTICKEGFKNYHRQEGDEYTGAIEMLSDEEGFLYPVVDASICIRCYKCIRVCPLKESFEA